MMMSESELTIIDAHATVVPPEIFDDADRIAAREPLFSEAVERGELVRWDGCASLEADVSWLSCVAFHDSGLCRAANDFLYEVSKESAGRSRWLASVSPMTRGAAAEAERCAELGAIGVGELTQSWLRWNIASRDETWRIAAACHETGLFMLVRAGELERTGAVSGWRSATDRDLHALARNHPELTIAASSLGGGLFLRETSDEFELELSNVRYVTSGLPPRLVRAALAAAPGKVIFGSGTKPQSSSISSLLDEAPSDARASLFSGAALELLEAPKIYLI